MFKLDKKTVIAFGIASVLGFGSSLMAKVEKNVDGSVIYPTKNGMYTLYHVNTKAENTKFNLGRKPTKNEIKAWKIEVFPDGEGLPEGKGSVEDGADLFDAKCAMCHGDMGMGGKGYPQLSGGEISSLKNQPKGPGDEAPTKTIGTYWPYASTLFWYIKSAMPFNHPMSLTNDQVYSLVAYLLSVNEIEIDGQELDDEYVLDKKKFLKIKMPNRNGFYPNVDGKNGVENMKKFLSNPKNYGTGSRCMHNCPRGKVVHIKYELNDFHPALSEKRDLPKEFGVKKVKTRIQKLYDETCKACHGNPAVGAPVVGDKKAWAERLKNGMDNLYKNGINGINGMPPKGGNPNLSDKDFKAIVDYMVNESK